MPFYAPSQCAGCGREPESFGEEFPPFLAEREGYPSVTLYLCKNCVGIVEQGPIKLTEEVQHRVIQVLLPSKAETARSYADYKTGIKDKPYKPDDYRQQAYSYAKNKLEEMSQAEFNGNFKQTDYEEMMKRRHAEKAAQFTQRYGPYKPAGMSDEEWRRRIRSLLNLDK